MFEVHYWWHWSGIVRKTMMVNQVMPIPWIEISEEMYNDFINS